MSKFTKTKLQSSTTRSFKGDYSQRFVKTDEPIETIAYAQGRTEANEKFVKALENNRGKAIRMVQVIIDFTSMEVLR